MPIRFSTNARRGRFETLECRAMLAIGPELLMDLNTSSLGATPLDNQSSESLAVNDIVYFRANDAVHGFELFRSDGTADGTWMVKDIVPGAGSSKPHSFFRMGDEFYFATGEDRERQQLWKSDGTDAGTTFVAQLQTPVGQSSRMLATNGKLFFVAGSVLYSTAGAPQQTSSLAGISDRPVLLNGVVYYAENGNSLRAHDDVNSQGWQVTTLAGNREIRNLTVAGDRLYFTWGAQLWTSDGSAGDAQLLKDFESIGVADNPVLLTPMGDNLYFVPFLNQSQKTALWRSDGTVAGTMQISPVGPLYGYDNRSMVVFKDHLAFVGRVNLGDPIQFYKSDGTAEGTRVISDMDGFPLVHESRSRVAELGGYLYFTGHLASSGSELWRTDLTAGGTQQVRDVRPGQLSAYPDAFSATSSRVFFFADPPNNGRELYSSDGTADGTGMVKDINHVTYSSDAREFVRLGDELLFVADNGPSGSEVFRTDGTATGTQLTRDIRGNENNSYPEMLTLAGNLAFFTAYTNAAGFEIWKSDGTRAGTRLVKDLRPGADFARVTGFAGVGEHLFFQFKSDRVVPELWKSDGTSDGTTLVKRFENFVSRSGDNPTYFNQMTDADGIAFFTFVDQEHGTELWTSDGTEAGTRRVKDIRPGPASALYNGPIVADGGIVYFSARDDEHGSELWRSDGTEEGTYLFAEVIPGAAGSFPDVHTVIDGIVYFNVRHPDYGMELWRTDGTTAGTWMVKDILPGREHALPRDMVEWNGLLYFIAYERDGGGEIWRTDGTAEGTWQVTDVVPGSTGSNITQVTPVGDRLYFLADDSSGRRLWQTGGSLESTTPVTVYEFPIAGAEEPLAQWSNPDHLIELNGNLYFTGDTPGIGNEIWRVSQHVDTNSAPILASVDARLETIPEDVSVNPGSLLADLLRGDGGGPVVADSDADSIIGVAVIAADNSHGQWQFTLDSGLHWFDFGSVAENAARLLAADYRTRVRFVPAADFFGEVNVGLQFRAWDATSGFAGAIADATTFGGATAFSENFGEASITVDEVNDPPTVLDDAVTVRDGAANFLIDVLANDSAAPDVEEAIALTGLSQPAQGGAAEIVDGKIELTINADFLGDIEFSYTVTDSRGGSATGNVLVRVAVPGDANFDQRVDLLDLNAVRNGFGGSGFGDVNDDGFIDLSDLNDVRNHFGESGNSSGQANGRYQDSDRIELSFLSVARHGTHGKAERLAMDAVFSMLAMDGKPPRRRTGGGV